MPKGAFAEPSVREQVTGQAGAAIDDWRALDRDAQDQVECVEFGVLRCLDPNAGGRPRGLPGRAVVVQVFGQQLRRGHRHIRGRFANHPLLDRPPLLFIGIQQRRAAPAAEHRGQLPTKIDRVTDPGIEPVATERRIQVRRIASKEHPSATHTVHHLHPGRPGIRRQDDRISGRSDRGVDQLLPIAFTGFAVYPERDHPPRVDGVDRTHERGRVRVDDPVLHRRPVRHLFD